MRFHAALALVLLLAPLVRADAAALTSDRDNTLFEDSTGSLSNGSGQYMFAGLTLEPFKRRGLVHFDLSAIPAGSTITGATLRLTESRGGSSPVPISLHRALAAWGEGASDAALEEGTGIAAAPGDATWLHSSFPSSFWSTPGGDFDPVESTSALVGGPAEYTWPSTARFVADIQDMLDHPTLNRGWLILGDESFPPTAKRFNTRENPDETTRPLLSVTYTVPTPGAAALAFSALLGHTRRRRN